MKIQFKVELELPEDTSVSEGQEYIKEAVQNWSKGGNPEDPLFYLDRDKVKVTRLRKSIKETKQAEEIKRLKESLSWWTSAAQGELGE